MRTRLVLLLLLLVTSFPLSAQSRSDACGWDPLSDSDSFPAHLASLVGAARADESAWNALTPLFSWFRGCDATAARKAALELRGLEPVTPLRRVLLGIALARGPEVQVPGSRGSALRAAHRLSNAELEARRLLERAAGEAHGRAAGLELAALALATRDRKTLVAARAALRAAAARTTAAQLQVALAEVELARGDYAAAEAAAGRAGAGSSACAWRLTAIARFMRGESVESAATFYLRGLASTNPDCLASYIDDMLPLLTPAELRAVDAARDPADWIRREWEWRAANAALTVGERLATHFRRVAEARAAYARFTHRGARPMDTLVPTGDSLVLPVDERGRIFIRHGKPTEVFRISLPRISMMREAWAYAGVQGGSVFEFMKFADYGDFVLVPPVACDPFLFMYGKGGVQGALLYRELMTQTGGSGKPDVRSMGGSRTGKRSRDVQTTTVVTHTPTAGWLTDFERVYRDYALSLGRYDPSLTMEAQKCALLGPRLAAGMKPMEVMSAAAEVERANRYRETLAQEVADAALVTETASLAHTRPLDALLSIYQLRNGEANEIVAVLGMAGSSIVPAGSNPVEYGLAVTLAAEDDATRSVQRADTSLAFQAPAPLRAEQMVRTLITLRAVTPGPITFRVGLRNAKAPEQGATLTLHRDVAAATSALSSSDLVIAEDRDGLWRRGSHRLAAIPAHQLLAGSRFRLFQELYGARHEQVLDYRITVAPGDPQGLVARLQELVARREALSLAFQETVETDADGVVRLSHTIDSGSLAPGSYVVEVRVRTAAGDDVKRETRLLILRK